MIIDGIEIFGVADEEEAAAYVRRGLEQYGSRLTSVNVELDGEYANIEYCTRSLPFDRIRRITGYLVGTTDRWNSAKRAELMDRVKHNAE